MPSSPPPRLLILDCDGVLIRSEAANLAYYNHLFEAFGLPRVEAGDRVRLNLLHTLSTPQVIDAFFPSALQDEAREAAGRLDFSRFLPLLEAEPGWAEVLPRLRGAFSIAVATNRGASASAVLGAVGLLPHLDAVLTIRDVRRPKPHPDLLLAALERFTAEAEAALYVGDSDLDLQAASAAGVPFLGFRSTVEPSAASAWEVESYLDGFAAGPLSASMPPAGATANPRTRQEATMSQKDMFKADDNLLKRGCQVSEGEVELCPCGSKKAFAKCHGAACECGSGKPKFKCCHTSDF